MDISKLSRNADALETSIFFLLLYRLDSWRIDPMILYALN